MVSFNQELPLATPSFIVNLTASDGDGALRDLTIQENGLTIPFGQLNFRTGQTANNPILIPTGDQGGFTYEIEITPSNTAAGDVTFAFLVTDTNGESASTQVTITYTSNPPTIALLSDATVVSGDTTIASFNTDFELAVELNQGDAFLSTLEVLAGGIALPFEQLTINGTPFIANPVVFADNITNATVRIGVSPVGVENTTQVYTLIVTDADGASSETTFTVIFDTPMTDLTFDTTGVFFNASGMGDGGLDLDTGEAVAFNSSEAEIEDEGIDLNTGGENWRTQFSATNDAVLKVVDLSTIGDGTTYDEVVTTAEISAAFDGGTDPTGSDNFPDADGDTSASETVTDPVQVGDVFAVQRAGRTYLIRIDEINFVAGSNDDNYKVSIKY